MATPYCKVSPGVVKKIRSMMGLRVSQRRSQVTYFTSAGVPSGAPYANNNGDICYDTTNEDLYIASGVTKGSATTWTKFVG